MPTGGTESGAVELVGTAEFLDVAEATRAPAAGAVRAAGNGAGVLLFVSSESSTSTTRSTVSVIPGDVLSAHRPGRTPLLLANFAGVCALGVADVLGICWLRDLPRRPLNLPNRGKRVSSTAAAATCLRRVRLLVLGDGDGDPHLSNGFLNTGRT